MKERSIHRDMAFPAHHQAAEISQPCKRPLYLPPTLIAPQLPSILQWRPRAVLAMRTNQLNTSPRQALTQFVRIAGFVVDQPLGSLPRTTATASGHGNRLQGRFDPFHFSWGRRVQEVSQRNTVAVDHHHPLRIFAPLGCAHAGPLFWPGQSCRRRRPQTNRVGPGDRVAQGRPARP